MIIFVCVLSFYSVISLIVILSLSCICIFISSCLLFFFPHCGASVKTLLGNDAGRRIGVGSCGGSRGRNYETSVSCIVRTLDWLTNQYSGNRSMCMWRCYISHKPCTKRGAALRVILNDFIFLLHKETTL